MDGHRMVDVPKRHPAFSEGHGEQRITVGEQKENMIRFPGDRRGPLTASSRRRSSNWASSIRSDAALASAYKTSRMACGFRKDGIPRPATMQYFSQVWEECRRQQS